MCIKDYLPSLNNRKWIIKFRLCNHKLSIDSEKGSYIDRFRRYCDLCDSESLRDEYHLLMECNYPININICRSILLVHENVLLPVILVNDN